MNPEVYIIAGIILGLLFTELTGLSPGGIIVPGYIALFFNQPFEIMLTGAAAAGVMLCIKLLSRFFFLFGRRRYALSILLGLFFKIVITYFFQGLDDLGNLQLIGWLIPGIIANDMYKQGIPRTVISAATVSALVFLLIQGYSFAFG